MKNADKFKAVFGLYATELWAMPEGEFLKWLNSECTETEQRWIPVSKRLPEENEYVLLCNKELEPDEEAGYSRMAVGWVEDGKFCCWDDRAARKEFVAWMPLPEPYRGEQKCRDERRHKMRTLEEILTDGIKDADWTYCKAEYAPHEGCKIGMPTEYTPDGTTKQCVETCYIVTAKFADGSIVSSPDYMYLSDGRFYWYDNLWYDTDTVDQEKTDELWNTPIAWIAYRNVAECERPYPLAPYNKDAIILAPPRPTE